MIMKNLDYTCPAFKNVIRKGIFMLKQTGSKNVKNQEEEMKKALR
jgi:hypothetical protein